MAALKKPVHIPNLGRAAVRFDGEGDLPDECAICDSRKLWTTGHACGTRETAALVMLKAPANIVGPSYDHLQSNQDDIGNWVAEQTDVLSGKAVADLLHTHIKQAADLVKALTTKDSKTASTVET